MLKWFSDKLYDMSKMFGGGIEDGFFERDNPAINASLKEIWAREPTLRRTYGNIKDMDIRIRHMYETLLEAERIILTGKVTQERKHGCMINLEGCARELAEAWCVVQSHSSKEAGGQLSLRNGYFHILPPPAGESYKICGIINC